MIEKVLVSASMALIAVGLAAPASANPVEKHHTVQDTGDRAAAALQKNYPTLTTDQAAHFVIAAYENLCPVPGRYDWWAYSTS
jgi:hypothetical protein